jgi:hypothetical protein
MRFVATIAFCPRAIENGQIFRSLWIICERVSFRRIADAARLGVTALSVLSADVSFSQESCHNSRWNRFRLWLDSSSHWKAEPWKMDGNGIPMNRTLAEHHFQLSAD